MVEENEQNDQKQDPIIRMALNLLMSVIAQSKLGNATIVTVRPHRGGTVLSQTYVNIACENPEAWLAALVEAASEYNGGGDFYDA